MECREELGFTNTSTGELRSFISYAMYVSPDLGPAPWWM
jgi:hypothetical protein